MGKQFDNKNYFMEYTFKNIKNKRLKAQLNIIIITAFTFCLLAY